MRPRGLIVSFGNASGPVPPVNLGILSTKGSLYVTRPTLATHIASRADLVEVMDPTDVRESQTHYLNGEFHFVLLEKEQP